MYGSGHHKHEEGVVFLALFGVLVVGLAAAAFLFVRHAQTKKSVSTTTAEIVQAGGSAISRSAENVQRKNDVAILLSAAAEYANGNQGQPPPAIRAGMLQGLGYYSGASVSQGEQPALASDQLRLVTSAACASGGATVAANARSYVAQYSLRQSDGSFLAQCMAG